MRALYHEFFDIPQKGRIREKVMLARITVSFIVMLICLAAMGITAYAYFSHSESSGYFTIQAAQFDATISISDPNGLDVPITGGGDNRYQAQLQANVVYTVTVQGKGTASTGFCVVTVDGSNHEYHTQQLMVDQAVTRSAASPLTFQLKLSSPSVVTFCARWGTSSMYDAYIQEGDGDFYITENDRLIEVPVTNSTAGGNADEDEGTTTSTEAVGTTATTASTQGTTTSVSSVQFAETTTTDTSQTTASSATSETATSVTVTETTATEPAAETPAAPDEPAAE